MKENKSNRLHELIEMMPAYIDTKKDQPFNGYWLQIHKRSMLNIQYIVKYVCDTFTASEISNPLCERILHKTFAPDLTMALAEMYHYLIENDLLTRTEE